MDLFMKQGFTLVELLVVILIVGILSAIALPKYTVAVENSRAVEAISNLGALRDSMDRYYFAHSSEWPSSLNQLDITIPEGKYFRFEIDTDLCKIGSKDCTLAAIRKNVNTKDQYGIWLRLKDTGKATLKATRCCGNGIGFEDNDYDNCGEKFSADSRGPLYCNAITGGKDWKDF